MLAVDRRSFLRGAAAALTAARARAQAGEAVVAPREYEPAFANPLKGWRPSIANARKHPFATLGKHYIRWNELENSAEDGVEKIRQFSSAQWKGLPEANTKVIPRVYLEWPDRGTYWPADLETGDYASDRFKTRLARLIEKLGEAWDNDPRVAFIEIGLIGRWGEHHHPSPTPEMQKLIGDAFRRNLPNKLAMNRYPWEFEDYSFGIYWDSFGHKEELVRHAPVLEGRLAERWKTAVMGGETAFDWGTPLGKNPTDAVANNADQVIELVRRLHWNHLGWLADYDAGNEQAARNGALIQKAFGYRFVIDQARYTANVIPGGGLEVALKLRNTGSTPFYYRWPVEVALLAAQSRRPVWSDVWPDLDIRKWLPGEHEVRASFKTPDNLEMGRYLLALSILDPAAGRPAARFAIANYLKGGRHPLGWIGVGTPIDSAEFSEFDDLAADRSLGYAT